MEEGTATSVNIAPPTVLEGGSTSPLHSFSNGGTNGAVATPPEGAQVDLELG